MEIIRQNGVGKARNQTETKGPENARCLIKYFRTKESFYLPKGTFPTF
jgi:hypothetical protein